MKSTLITSMMRPEVYPHPVREVRLLETHISWLLLTGDFVYKIKKPVNLGFLDFSRLEQRKFYCQEELRLNQRYAPDLYLDVVAICGTETEPCLGEGEAIEFAVKMREFDQRCLLDQIVERRGLELPVAQKIADTIARFHQQIAIPSVNNQAVCEAGDGSLASIRDAAEQNFEQVESLLTSAPSRRTPDQSELLVELRAWTADAMVRLAPQFLRRKAEGFVRECHGDLHLGNMAFIQGEVRLFDCIEFNKSFRCVDTACEIAFVIMDLEYRNNVTQANYLLNAYLERCGDYSGLAVLDFYKVYLAMVRAKVNLLKAKDASETNISFPCVSAFNHYLALADRYTQPKTVYMAITHGLSGTGKSTVAAKIAGVTQAIRIRSDVERKRLFGLAANEKSDSQQGQGIYTPQATRESFDHLGRVASEVIAAGYPCIVDATFIRKDLRDQFHRLANTLGVPFRIVDCQASEGEIRRRLIQREKAGKAVSEAGVEVMEAQLNKRDLLSQEEKNYTVEIDTEQAVLNASWAAEFVSRLTQEGANQETANAYDGE